jgi:hypothetical protein
VGGASPSRGADVGGVSPAPLQMWAYIIYHISKSSTGACPGRSRGHCRAFSCAGCGPGGAGAHDGVGCGDLAAGDHAVRMSRAEPLAGRKRRRRRRPRRPRRRDCNCSHPCCSSAHCAPIAHACMLQRRSLCCNPAASMLRRGARRCRWEAIQPERTCHDELMQARPRTPAVPHRL